MLGAIAALLSGGLGLLGSAAGAVASTAVGLGTGALSMIGSAGGAALSTAGTVAGGAAGLAGQAVEGGLTVLGGLPAATTKTLDYLGTMTPAITQGITTYQKFFSEPQAGPVPGRGSVPQVTQRVPQAFTLPTLASRQAVPIDQPASQVVMTTPGPAAAQPDYLLYAAIAVVAIILLRK